MVKWRLDYLNSKGEAKVHFFQTETEDIKDLRAAHIRNLRDPELDIKHINSLGAIEIAGKLTDWGKKQAISDNK